MTSVGCRSGVHWMRENVALVDRCGDRARKHGLRRPGHVLEQHMAARDQCGEHETNLVGLPVHHLLDVRGQTRNQVGGSNQIRIERLLIESRILHSQPSAHPGLESVVNPSRRERITSHAC